MKVEYTANIKLKIVEKIKNKDDLIDNPREFFDRVIMDILTDITAGNVTVDLISNLKLEE